MFGSEIVSYQLVGLYIECLFVQKVSYQFFLHELEYQNFSIEIL